MKNKFSHITLAINVILVFIGIWPILLLPFYGKNVAWLLVFPFFSFQQIIHISLASLLIIFSTFILILSFKNKESLSAKIPNIILLILGLVINIYIIHSQLTFRGF